MVRSKLKVEPVYTLKHRITGAAIMVTVSVLAIPLLLKEPGIEASVAPIDDGSENQQSFKSKIEPMNLDTIEFSASNDSDEIAGDEDSFKPALLEINNGTSQQDASEDKESASADNNLEQVEIEVEGSAKEKVVMTKDSANESSVSESSPASEESPQQQPVEEIALAEGSWTVRVGTFTKSENVESVSTLLNNSGFNARHTKVQTTLGEATRVWLGPYAKKKTAEKVSSRLKKLTGEKGYVTKHTS